MTDVYLPVTNDLLSTFLMRFILASDEWFFRDATDGGTLRLTLMQGDVTLSSVHPEAADWIEVAINEYRS